MNTVEYLKIVNFQKHSKLHIDFCDGLNAIVGPTDSGKSSVIRALIWLFRNEPVGDSFRKKGTKETYVEAKIDGKLLKRFKSSTENYYEFDGKRFEAMRGKVPDIIAEFLNLSDVNIHTQHESHFLLSQTSGEVGRFINKIVNLSVMDSSMKLAASELKTAKDTKVRAEIEVKRIKSELSKYNWIDSFEKKLKRLEARQALFDSKVKSYDELYDLIQNASEIQSQLSKLSDYSTLAKKLEKLSKRYKEHSEFSSSVTELIDALEDAQEIEDQLEENKKYSKFAKRIDKLQTKLSDWILQEQSFSVIDDAVTSYIETKENMLKQKEELLKLERQLSDMIGEVCPLCGQEVKTKKRNRH